MASAGSVGLLLSSGLDSTALTALARAENPNIPPFGETGEEGLAAATPPAVELGVRDILDSSFVSR
jgi:asparagine synthetase B (glutamine-hydrolysing)